MQMKPSPLERLAPTAALLLLTGTAAAQAPWTQLSPASGPSAREGAATANDGSTMYLSGGKQGTNVGGYDELWSFDGTDWTLETPAGGGFPARGTHATAWDAARSVLVLFGGTTNSPVWPTRLNDTWEWTPAGGWVPASPLTSPDPVGFIDMVYVPGLGCVVHGGAAMDASGVAYTSGDTWAYDGTTWTKIATGPVVTNGKLVHRAAQPLDPGRLHHMGWHRVILPAQPCGLPCSDCSFASSCCNLTCCRFNLDVTHQRPEHLRKSTLLKSRPR